MRTAVVAVVLLAVAGCGEVQDVDVDALKAELDLTLSDDLAMYVHDVTANGARVRVLTQLDESQTAEADAICNNTTVAAYGLDGVDVSGVDVAAAGGRNIAHCEPRV